MGVGNYILYHFIDYKGQTFYRETFKGVCCWWFVEPPMNEKYAQRQNWMISPQEKRGENTRCLKSPPSFGCWRVCFGSRKKMTLQDLFEENTACS